MVKKQKIIDAKNVVLIVIVLVLAGFFGLVLPYLRSRGAPEQAAPTGKHDVTVLYGEGGFVPQTVTIKLGQTVAWRNPSGKPMWVGSDPHPAHTDLKGFDQGRVINRATPSFIGQANAHGSAIYEYTFTKVGRWGYHNHLFPAHTGMVIVEE